jgi:hypothetical protein
MSESSFATSYLAQGVLDDRHLILFAVWRATYIAALLTRNVARPAIVSNAGGLVTEDLQDARICVGIKTFEGAGTLPHERHRPRWNFKLRRAGAPLLSDQSMAWHAGPPSGGDDCGSAGGLQAIRTESEREQTSCR